MTLTLVPLLVVIALICAVAAAAGQKYAPLWVAVVLLCIVLLIQTMGR